MTYDWDGQRTRRLQIARLAVAIFVGLIFPIVVMTWSYVVSHCQILDRILCR